jgi:3-oxoacyl-[acyl-carrier protein] reductase
MQEQRKIALVTGASRGIGAAIATRLAGDGFDLVVNYASNTAEANAVVAALRKLGARAVAIKADIADPAQVRAMFGQAEQELGKIDVVVNNAGMMKVVPLASTSDELFERSFSTNVRGTFNTMREAATRLNQGGRIVNLSSSLVGMNLPGYAIYTATKAAVESFTHIFAKELRGRHITVNAVAPGPVATELFLSDKTPEQVEQFAKMPPLERLAEPEDIASVVAFLVSPAGSWVNGQVLRANGGLV